jgi:allophanate hydrolase
LAGLSFAAKDNIDVAGVPTTAACPAFAYTPMAHAAVVQKLLDAGAQLLGKTNLDQFACGLNGTRSPHGAVPNALNPACVSGGSSSGSAYVVATEQVDFALGTDTAGSGRVPAGLNNIVGLKPSRGLISAFGVVPAAQSIDCVSIFGRTVATAAKVLLASAWAAQWSLPRSSLMPTASISFQPGTAIESRYSLTRLVRSGFLTASTEVPLSLPQFTGYSIQDAPKCMENNAPPMVSNCPMDKSFLFIRILL